MRRRVLEAAREVFADAGYEGATTRRIADRAEVQEALLFRSFESKHNLFDIAVTGPFTEFLDQFTARWLDPERAIGTPQEVLRHFVTDLHRLVAGNRELFTAIHRVGLDRAVAATSLGNLEAVGERLRASTGVGFDVPVAIRLATLWVISTAVLGEVVFDGIASEERVVEEMIRMLVGAALYRP